MKRTTVSRTLAAFGTVAALAWASQAYAVEPGGVDPHEPGISNGIPAGALPPPGFYFTNDLSYIDGSLKDGKGNNVTVAPTNVIAWVNVPVLLWSSPFHILGAQYAAAVIQPLVTASVTTLGSTGTKTGLFNTVITPGILSWRLPVGFFVSTSFSVYLPDGDTGDRGEGTSVQQHIANNTWTFAPGAAISWFNGAGLEVSLNGEYDIQTENSNFFNGPIAAAGGLPGTIKYQTGNILNLDYTVQQAFGKWTAGVVGYYVRQMQSDQTTTSIPAIGLNSTASVPEIPGLNGSGNRFEKFAIGPSVAYNFGPVTFNVRYTRDLFAKNATENDVFWFRFSLPL